MSDADDMPLLYQFRLSMFPEKVRWVLDHKKIAHVRRSLLPGPHIPAMMRLSGQKSTPVLAHKKRLIIGSAEIVDYLDQRWPAMPIYPRSLNNKRLVLDLQRDIDAAGMHIRRAFFHVALAETQWIARRFTYGTSRAKAGSYRAVFPFFRMAMRADMDISQKTAEQSLGMAQRMADRLANTLVKKPVDERYLLDGRFGLSDITAASVFHPVALPPEYPVPNLEPLPDSIQAWLDQWSKHPISDWVSTIYRQHRGTSMAVKDIG